MPLCLFLLDFKHTEDKSRVFFLYPGDSLIFK